MEYKNFVKCKEDIFVYCLKYFGVCKNNMSNL